jgi:hypothetical protein
MEISAQTVLKLSAAVSMRVSSTLPPIFADKLLTCVVDSNINHDNTL